MTAERLQKVMAAAGVGSRRTCETLITEGRVQVNGKVVTELGAKADPRRDRIMVDGKPLKQQAEHVYYKVHKPRGVISDIGGDEIDLRTGELRKTVDDLLPEGHPRVFPVGRLDLHSEGLVLLTDDGELANRLTHPRYQHPKTYYVLLAEKPPYEVLDNLRKGVDLPEGRTAPAEVVITDRLPSELRLSRGPSEGVWLRVVLREGKKRQIRHMTAAVGYPTLRLVRWAIGPLKMGRLELGEAEPLSADEINALRTLAGLPATARPASPKAGATRTDAGKAGGARPRKSLPPTGQRARVDETRPGRRPAARPGLRVTARKYSATSTRRESGQDEESGSSAGARPSNRKPYAARASGARPSGARPGGRPGGSYGRRPGSTSGGSSYQSRDAGASGVGESDTGRGESGAASRAPRSQGETGQATAGRAPQGKRTGGPRPGGSNSGGRPTGKPGRPPGDRPPGKSTGKAGGPAGDRPAARPPGKYNVKVTKRPAKPAGKPKQGSGGD